MQYLYLFKLPFQLQAKELKRRYEINCHSLFLVYMVWFYSRLPYDSEGEGEVMGAGVEGYHNSIFVGIFAFLINSDK